MCTKTEQKLWIEDFGSWGVKELGSCGVRVVRGGVCNKTSPYYPNSLTPQLRKSEIFAKVFVCRAKRSAQKHEQKLRISGVGELRSSDLHILNGAYPVWSPCHPSVAIKNQRKAKLVPLQTLGAVNAQVAAI